MIRVIYNNTGEPLEVTDGDPLSVQTNGTTHSIQALLNAAQEVERLKTELLEAQRHMIALLHGAPDCTGMWVPESFRPIQAAQRWLQRYQERGE